VAVLDPIPFSAIRFGAAALAAFPLFLWAKPWRWPANDMLRAILCGLFSLPGLNIPSALAARTIPAGGIGLITATEPIFIILFGLIATRTRLTWRIAAGAVIALAGVALAMSRGTAALFDPTNAANVAWGLAGAASWGVYTIACVPLVARYGAYRVTGAVLVTGGAISSIAIALLLPGNVWPGPGMFGQIALLALFSSVIGFLLWNQSASRLPPQLIGPFLYLIPVVGIVGGVAILREPLTWQMLLGALAVIFGVTLGEGRIGNSRKRR
jgi:drug/metabolite transporter (DMT)-like permease